MKQFFEEVGQSVRGGHVQNGARLGGLMVLLILIIGAIDQTAGMPRNVYRQIAQAATGGACDKNSMVVGGASLGETEATKAQKATCTPLKCFVGADGGTTCTTPGGAGGLVSGLMSSIGQVLGSLMSGGGGSGGDSGSGSYTPPGDVTTPPKCTGITASSGKKAVDPNSEVTLSWALTGGTPETFSFVPSLTGASVYSTSAVVTPQKSTTYVLTVKNKAGESKCSVRVYVGAGSYSDVGDTTGETVTDDTSTEGTSLTDPLTGTSTTGTGDTNGDGKVDDKDTKYTDTTNLGYIASKGVKTNLVADNNAFTEDKGAFKTDANAFQVEDLTADEDFDNMAKDLGSDGIYSKEDISTLERLARENEIRKNARVHATIDDNSQLSAGEVQDLWNRPGEGHTGSLTENIFDEGDIGTAKVGSNEGVFSRFGIWLKRTFCFWCSVENVSILSANQLAAAPGIICVGSNGCGSTPAPKPAAPAPKPAPAAPKGNDAECAAMTKKLQESICRKNIWDKNKCSGPGKLKPDYEYVPVEENKLPGSGIIPAAPVISASVILAADSAAPAAKTPPDKQAKCMQRKDIEKMAKGCGKCPKGVSFFATETLSQGVTACGTGTTAGDPLKYVCREENKPAGKDSKTGEPCATPGQGTCQSTTPGNGNGNGNSGNGNSGNGNSGSGNGNSGSGNSGSGNSNGGGLADTKMGQGLGEGLGKGLAEMLKGGQQQQQPSSGQGANDKPWWWDSVYGQNTPTEAPKCVEDTEAEPAQVITKGESTTISWTVTGKGTIKMVVNYVTSDDVGNQSKGTLGVVDGGSAEVSPDYTTIYKLKATNEIGTVTCKPIKVIVKPPAEDDGTNTVKGEVDLTCDPESIKSSDPATIVWSCPSNATSSLGTSTEDGTFSTDGKTEGSYEAKPLRDATYVVRCRDKFDKEVARNSCSVKVTDSTDTTGTTTTSTSHPKVQISAEPPAAPQGSSVTIRWKSQDTASCVVYGPGCDTYGKDSPKCFKEVGRSGFVTGNLYETSTFRAECLAPDRKTRVSDSVTVEVSASGDEEAATTGE